MTRRVKRRVVLFAVLAYCTCAWIGLAQYKVTSIQHGGSLRGRVFLTPGSRQVEGLSITKDDAICGSTPSRARLELGTGGGVVNAVVYIDGIREGKQFASARRPALSQHGCEFLPHVVLLRQDDPLEVVNNDGVLHNVHAYDYEGAQRTLFNIAQPIKGLKARIDPSQFRNARFVMVTCDAGHPWMSAFLVREDHPYYAVTDDRGSFRIDNIPPGKYTLALWHEGVSVVRREMEKGKVTRYTFEEPYTQSKQVVIPPGGSAHSDFEVTLR